MIPPGRAVDQERAVDQGRAIAGRPTGEDKAQVYGHDAALPNSVLAHWLTVGNSHTAETSTRNRGDFSRIAVTTPSPPGVGSSQPLPVDVARDARESFGRDFSAVRVYADAAANESAAELSARAYAFGQHLVFGPAQYRPSEPAGRALIAHELAHVAQQSSGLRSGQSTVSHLEAEAESAAEGFAQGRPVALTGQALPAIACNPDDPQQDIEDDESDRADRAEDIAEGKTKPKRGAGRGQPAGTPGEVAREAERDVQRMLDDAIAGKYRSSAIKTERQLVARFRRLIRWYRMGEMVSIERQLAAGNLSAQQRRVLVNQKKGIIANRSNLQSKFDEAVRTPRGDHVSVQEVHVRGALAHDYHATTPGKDGFAQLDFSMTGSSEVGGRIRLHVNLKSHDLGGLSLADGRAIARKVRDQAVMNASGSPKRTGDVGHLPQGEKIIISFTDNPPRNLQAAMVEVMFEEGTPISQVRFGESTWHRPAGPSEPPVTPLETLLGEPARSVLEEPVRPPGVADRGVVAAPAKESPLTESEVRPTEVPPRSGTTAEAAPIAPESAAPAARSPVTKSPAVGTVGELDLGQTGAKIAEPELGDIHVRSGGGTSASGEIVKMGAETFVQLAIPLVLHFLADWDMRRMIKESAEEQLRWLELVITVNLVSKSAEITRFQLLLDKGERVFANITTEIAYVTYSLGAGRGTYVKPHVSLVDINITTKNLTDERAGTRPATKFDRYTRSVEVKVLSENQLRHFRDLSDEYLTYKRRPLVGPGNERVSSEMRRVREEIVRGFGADVWFLRLEN